MIYTLPYFGKRQDPAIIISFTIPGNIYPVIEKHTDSNSLMGKVINPGYNSHYVLVLPNGNVPNFEKQACPEGSSELLDTSPSIDSLQETTTAPEKKSRYIYNPKKKKE
eukprot:TRINITY_DN10100_c0_g5_i2.p1 TRINITY_DN10100_c0_g5~~TRINITY_DN10100_c0_g5_i2.p1  ORF type:complete len:109 (-),score=24.82 TRINITY_DN10100_c0_g5_i2:252-578(-)